MSIVAYSADAITPAAGAKPACTLRRRAPGVAVETGAAGDLLLPPLAPERDGMAGNKLNARNKDPFVA